MTTKTRQTWSDLQKTAIANARKAKAKEKLTMAQTIERYRAESGDSTRTDAAITTALYAKPSPAKVKAIPAKGGKRSAKPKISPDLTGDVQAKPRTLLDKGNVTELVGGVLDLLGSQIITKGEAADLIVRVKNAL